MSGARRTGLVIFGALLIVLFAYVALAEGIGHPSVPSDDIALVENVPGDVGNITRAEYDRSFLQTWKRGGLKAAPKSGDAQYEQIKEAAINDQLDQAWLTGEAAELGIEATDREVATQFKSIRSDQFPSEAAFQKFLKDSNFTLEEVRERVKLQVLSTKIEDQITNSVKDVPQDQIEQTYEDSKANYTTPETRDISLIVTDNKADADKVEAALQQSSDAKEFAKLAKQYSTHGSSTQGGKTVATEGAFPDPAGSEIMSGSEGELAGPVKAGSDYYFFKVNKVNPETTKSVEEVTPQIKQQLLPALQQKAMSDFVADYTSKWTSRTFCAGDYVVARCSNFEGDGRLDSADPACYEKGAADSTKPLSCPAPVGLRVPQSPGGAVSADPLAPGAGADKPQGPVAPGDAADAAAGAAAAAAAAAAAGGAAAVPPTGQ